MSEAPPAETVAHDAPALARPTPRQRAVGTAQVALAACSWGCWSLFLRPSGLSVRESAPFVFAVMGLAMLPFVRAEIARPRWDRRSVALLLGNVACDALNVVFFFAALQVTTVGVAVLSHYLAPLVVAVAAPHVDRRRVRGAVPAALIALGGLTLVLEPWREGREAVALGAALGAASALFYAGNVFIAARLGPRIGATRAVSWHALLAALVLAPFARPGELAAADATGLAILALGAVVLGGVSGVLFVRGLKGVGPTRGAMLAMLEPLVAVAVGWIAWGERLGATALAGGLVVVAAGAWVAAAPGEPVGERPAA